MTATVSPSPGHNEELWSLKPAPKTTGVNQTETMYITLFSTNLSDVEELLWVDDGFRAQFVDLNKSFHIVVETNNAAKAFDAHDESMRHTARTSVSVAQEQRQGTLNHSLFSGQRYLPVFWIY